MAKSREQKRIERKQRKAKMRAEQYAEAAKRKGGTNKKTVERNRKTNGYKSGVLRAKRNQKRLEAEQRQKAYSKLSFADKVKLIDSRPGYSKREMARISK